MLRLLSLVKSEFMSKDGDTQGTNKRNKTSRQRFRMLTVNEQLTVSRHHRLACWCCGVIPVSFRVSSTLKVTITAQLQHKLTTLTADGTHAKLAYFLKSVLKSPKAAPELEVVGVLSWPASTAASAPPWSLYRTAVDMFRIQRTSL